MWEQCNGIKHNMLTLPKQPEIQLLDQPIVLEFDIGTAHLLLKDHCWLCGSASNLISKFTMVQKAQSSVAYAFVFLLGLALHSST
jgi:hypothetical protein